MTRLATVDLFRPLAYRTFALLWSGQTISRFGDSLYRVALAWWVLEKTGSAAAMGTVLIFSFAPMLIFLLVGGVAVDRLPRARVMLASDLLRGGLVLGVALLAVVGSLELWHVFVASMLFGFVDAFFQPAYSALVPEVAPGDVLPGANALTSLSAQLTGIFGPMIGAGIVALGGTPSAFALDGLSFFLSAACLVPLQQLRPPRAPTGKPASMLRDVREGIGTVLSIPWLWATIALAGLANITMMGPLGTAMPLLVKNTLHADVGTLGLVYTMIACGSVLGALVLGRLGKLHHRGLLAYGAWIGAALTTITLGLPVGLAGVLAATFLGGLGVAVFSLIWTHTLQELVPRELLGRVSSIDMLGSFALVPVGYAVAGWAADQYGAPLVFVVGGALTATMTLLGLAHPRIRDLD